MVPTPQENLRHHGEALATGDLDGIISDFTDDAVLITPQGTFRGTAGAREAWLRLLADLPNPKVDASSVVLEGDVALMAWAASSDKGRVDDGIDTVVVNGEGIKVMTVHYTPAR
jgi:ketosteroid isomerase-like protein